MLVNMNAMINQAIKQHKAIPGFNIFGFEDAKAVIQAAEQINAPVILMTNKDAVEHISITCCAKLFCEMAALASVPVCIHLDHARDIESIVEAINAGYTSVMYDGSQLDISENIKNTKEVVKLARSRGVSIEAEIGSVPYTDKDHHIKSIYTNPKEAAQFEKETGIDVLAVAVGTLHRMQVQKAQIQYDRLEEIQSLTKVPMVIHGSTGISDVDFKKLVQYRIGKFNIGTALRLAFGNALKEEVKNKPEEFDRIKLFKKPMEAVKKAAYEKYKILGW